MSTNNRVFEETVEIKYIDRDVKVFDKFKDVKEQQEIQITKYQWISIVKYTQ